MLGRTAIKILKVILLLISLFLAYEGTRYSYFSSKDYTRPIFEMPDFMIWHLAVFAGVCLAAGLIFAASRLVREFRPVKGIFGDGERLCRAVLLTACIWVAAVGLLYIREHPYYPTGDQINTAAGAAYAGQGNFDMFVKGGYIGMYGQQKGLLFLYEIVFQIFGDFCFGVIARIHLLLGIITVAAGYSFLKIVAGKPVYRILYCIMMMFCMPYIIYLPYVYGDLSSICFSTILFWALAAYGKSLERRYVVFAAIAGALALLVRTNIWIVLIAVGIGMFLSAMEKGSLRPVLAGLCIILAAWGAVGGVNKMYEYRSGYKNVESIPSILWIAMGMQETEGNPGVYNRYQQTVFEDCDFEAAPAAEIGKEYIAERLKEFGEDPSYAAEFFIKKLKMQWLEPLFEGLYATRPLDDEYDTIPEWAESLYYGDLHNTVWKAANYYQSVIYLAVLAFVICSLFKRREYLKNSAGWIPVIAVVGGFLFSIIWESQCRYVLPYYMYLILYASVGIGSIAEAIGGFAVSFTGRTGAQGEEETTKKAA